jgi:hypothetical protein
LEHICETVEFNVNSRQVLTVTLIDAMALSTVCVGHHESGHLSAPTSVTQREIVLGAPLEIADSTIGTADRVDETATTHVVAVAVATGTNVVLTVVIEKTTAAMSVNVSLAEIVIGSATGTRTVDTTIMNGIVNARDAMTRVAREVRIAIQIKLGICNLAQEIIADTMTKLAVAVDQEHRQLTIDDMTPALCLSTLCSTGSPTDRRHRPRTQLVQRAHPVRKCRSPSELQRARGPRVANVLKLLNETVWSSS